MTPTDKIVWRKSSRSNGNGGACVELTWRKSSRSGSNGGECIELAHPALVRDSKNPATTLAVDLSHLIAAIKADHLTR